MAKSLSEVTERVLAMQTVMKKVHDQCSTELEAHPFNSVEVLGYRGTHFHHTVPDCSEPIIQNERDDSDVEKSRKTFRGCDFGRFASCTFSSTISAALTCDSAATSPQVSREVKPAPERRRQCVATPAPATIYPYTGESCPPSPLPR